MIGRRSRVCNEAADGTAFRLSAWRSRLMRAPAPQRVQMKRFWLAKRAVMLFLSRNFITLPSDLPL